MDIKKIYSRNMNLSIKKQTFSLCKSSLLCLIHHLQIARLRWGTSKEIQRNIYSCTTLLLPLLEYSLKFMAHLWCMNDSELCWFVKMHEADDNLRHLHNKSEAWKALHFKSDTHKLAVFNFSHNERKKKTT